MRRKVPFLIMAMVLISICIGSLSAFAAGDDADVRSIQIPSGDKKYMQEVWSKMGVDGDYLKLQFKLNSRTEPSDTRLLAYDDATGTIKFNMTNFNSATDKSRKNAMGIFVRELQDSLVSKQTQQNIFDSMKAAERDVALLLIPLVMDSTSADVFTAMKWMNPILPIIRLLFGIGAIVITILLVGSTIIDLAFIGLPVAREAIINRSEGNGSKKPAFITSDAISVIQDTESALDSAGGYKNAYVMYFKRRALTYIILSICLLYLVVGELGGLIAWLLKLGSGVV